MRELNREFWSQLLAQLNDPSVGVVAKALADAHNLEVGTACDSVEDAIDEGILVEEDTGGAFDVVRLPEEDDPDNETVESPETGDIEPREGRPDADTPKGKTVKTPEEKAVDALRDVLRFYNARVDDTIDDHTEEGDHPERPTTAREYFTEGRGWDDDTVDDLLLGWAPPDHSDELVAYLHDRGHDREAILATGAVGKTDSGGFYTTFQGRYVLPYYDADGEPAYAIARVTGGDGGGAKGYGGHPSDYQAGKYAKLRHTDDRVPFDEPIYGLDTLDEGAHVVVAEGIADAITARELGYSVLSPVAKEFKEAHYGPLADALDDHGVGRMTIVADADGIRNDDTDEDDPETIGDAVSRALSPVGAGLAGSLRTATKLGDRTEADIRVTVPPAPAALANDLDEFVNGPWKGDLDALLASAKPADAFPQLDEVVSNEPAAGFDEFDPEDYEPTATTAEETTDDIRDIYAALDRLDAQRVADRTIVSEWLEGRCENRTFAPVWAPAGYTGTANFVDCDKWVDTGGRGGYGGPAVMAAIDAGLVRDTECPQAVSGETWLKAVDHLRDLGFSIPKLDRSGSDKRYQSDPREVGATVDPRRAWDAAGRVTPDQVDDLDASEADSERFACPVTGKPIDVVRAVALEEGLIDDPEAPLADRIYPKAYAVARDRYDAPLPEYYTTTDAIAEFNAVLDVIGETTFFDLDVDALATDVTAEEDEVDGAAVRALNPAWRESESGASVLVFENGTIWDADTETVIDVVRFAALDAGLINDPDDDLAGEDFTHAYGIARDVFDAPLPRWDPAADAEREVTPQLPPAEELTDARNLDGVDPDALKDAREEVENLLREVTAEEGSPTIVSALPATGKTTGTVKTARGLPLSYLCARKELQAQALEKAVKWDVDARLLPVFAEENVADEVLSAATKYVRENGKDRLRNLWKLVEAALNTTDEDGEEIDVEDIFVGTDDEDEVDLDRPTCPVADGEYGPAWALAVHVARRLGYTPQEIHQQARGLFGSELPCSEGGKTCPYTKGWEHARDPDDTADLLVGSYVHAHVDSVRTAYSRDVSGNIETEPRPIVLDEFVGGAFTREFDDLAPDHAVWLAGSFSEDIEDRRDLYESDLTNEEHVREWLDGNADEVEGFEDAIAAFGRMHELLDAREEAAEILDEVDTDLLENLGVCDPLGQLAHGGDDSAVFRDLNDALDGIDVEQPGAGLERWIRPAVVEPLAKATLSGSITPTLDDLDIENLPIAGDLRRLVEEAADGVREGEEAARPLLAAAKTSLRGGREGCRRLAAWANDGYAHPDAHHLLEAALAKDAKRIDTDAWAFDERATEGTSLDVVDTHGRATTVLDRNGHGALLHNPPGRTDAGGEDVPLVGLDATARRELWSVALGEDVSIADIHDTPAERAAFLEDALDLRVLRAADRPRYYEGSPASKDTDGDVALLQKIAKQYAGIYAPRRRGEEATVVGNPAAITTKGVREVLENDSRLDDAVSTWENYGNLKGSNELGDQRLAAILGCQHYGDHAIERFAALAGEEVDTDRRSGRGADLAYGSEIGDAYLKHMTEDQTMQAILRFARGDSGATVVARTSALRADLPVVGEAQVVETWSETATTIVRHYRTLGREFTTADVRDVVDVGPRQVRRVLAELADAGYIRRVKKADGRATTYERVEDPNAGEVDLPSREEAVAPVEPGNSATKEYYTWNVRVHGGDPGSTLGTALLEPSPWAAPPAPDTFDGVEPPS